MKTTNDGKLRYRKDDRTLRINQQKKETSPFLTESLKRIA